MRGEVISVLSLETISSFVTSEGSERGTKYDIVTRAIKLILPSLECDNLSHTCALIWGKNQIVFFTLFTFSTFRNECKIIV